MTDVRETYYKAWTAALGQELIEDKFDWLCSLHREIVIRICNAIPSRHDVHDKIATDMDPIIFRQMLDNNVFGGKEFMTLVEYVYNWIKKLSSPARDKSIIESEAQLMTNVGRGHTIAQLVPAFILGVHKHLDDLETDLGRDITKDFRRMIEMSKK